MLVLEETPEENSSPVAVVDDVSSNERRAAFVKTSLAIGFNPSSQGPVEDLTETPLPQSNSVHPQLPGYVIERELGRGGMGAVYLGRQLSLDRQVAIKVMSKRWAADPVFVARFTREAYAAAQLSHPNIVQIHDIGEVEGSRFFSMEYVRGRSLSELVRIQGKLDPETAVGYVLQAARGLKHAHDCGMIHRDVKPDNLLLDEQGLVKVADLGLVKTPAVHRSDDQLAGDSGAGLGELPSNMTGARIALGTPAYMSPEQCRDAATVDRRADIYSLGCTLYVLVTGRPPFNGTSDVELMTKHVYDQLVPPEQIAARVPKEVSAVIQRMMEKNPDDRFQSMGEVIRTLEAWLGVYRTGTFSPNEEHISKLESCTSQFNTAKIALLRRRLITGFYALLGLSSVLILFFGNLQWVFGLAGLGVQSALVYFVLVGVARQGPLFTRSRIFINGLSCGDWVVGIATFSLFCMLLAMLKVFWIWLGFGLIGVGVAIALRLGVDRGVEAERRTPLDACERLLRRLRLQGLDEEELRQFVAKFSGRNWEELFEALFGYEAKMTARLFLLRSGSSGNREKHATWREPLIGAMERIEKARRESRERKLLQSIEQAQLIATGATPEAAEYQAKAAADAMVKAAGQVREAEEERVRVGSALYQNMIPVNVRAVLTPQQKPLEFVPTQHDPLGKFVGLLVGPQVRAALASILLAGCALWVYQNALFAGSEFKAQAAQVVESRDFTQLKKTAARDLKKPTSPLAIDGVPASATDWLDGWNAGFAGLLLFGSLFYRGNLMGMFVLLGAAVAALGNQYGIRTVEPFRAEHVALMLGSVLALIGLRVGTR